MPATNVKELVAWVKASPGKHSYAHAGLGTPGYLAGEMLKQAFGLDLVAVSFNGGGPAITSTIGGHTPILYTSIFDSRRHVKRGTVRAIAVTGAHRSPALPDVPTLAEAGARDQESEIILGVLVPAGTRRTIVARLHGEIVEIVALPDVRERLAALGFEPIASTPKEFADRITVGDRQMGEGHSRRATSRRSERLVTTNDETRLLPGKPATMITLIRAVAAVRRCSCW